MREILYKAKHITVDKWYEGYYVKIERLHYIAVTNEGFENGYRLVEVNPETICQFAGLTDKNGNKIWENDIVRFEDTGEDGYEYREGFDFVNMAKVVYNNSRWELDEYMSENSYVFENQDSHGEFCDLWEYTEVIGNIFDNPELLEGGLE